MQEEHMMILKMLEEGKITAEEAAALIEAVDEATGASGGAGFEEAGEMPEGARPEEAWRDASQESSGAEGEKDGAAATGRKRPYRPDLSRLRGLADKLSRLAEVADGPALENLAGRIERTVERAMREKERVLERAMREKERAIERMEKGISKVHWHHKGHGVMPPWAETFTEPLLGIFSPGVKVEKVLEGTFAEESRGIDVEATTSNGSITIEPWDETGFRIEVRAHVRMAGGDPKAAQAKLDEDLEYETTAGGLRIKCNAGGAISGASLTMRLPRKLQYDLALETSNGKVEIGSLDCSTIEAETSNGRITLDETRAATAELETSNGRIQCTGTARKLTAETSNGRIVVAPGKISGEAKYELETSNGSIEVQLATDAEVGYSIEAETSLGGIHVDLPDLVYRVNSGGMGHREVVAITSGYDEKANRLRIKAETSNGSITVTGVSK